MNQNETEVANNIIDKLGVDPCLLAIVVITLGFLILMGYTAQRKENVERQRVKDALDAVERIIGKGQNNGE